MPADYFTFAHAFNDTARLTHKHFALLDPKTKTPIIPLDPICITDFLLDQDLIRSLECTNPGFPRSGFEFRDNNSQGRREVSFKGPLSTRTRKHADTPYLRTVPFQSIWQSRKCHGGHGDFLLVPKSFYHHVTKYKKIRRLRR
jgi:hypothetical protein